LAAASSAISRNQGQGTITEPDVMKPLPATATKAVLAPWHMPMSSAWAMTSFSMARFASAAAACVILVLHSLGGQPS